jgi:hypothetical protein
MSFTHVEGEKPLSPNMKGFRVQCLGTVWAEGTRCLLLCRAELWPTQRGPFEAWQPQPSLGTQEAPGPHAMWFAPEF